MEVLGPLSWNEGGSTKEKPKEVEMEMDDDVPQEESVDIQSPKRKVVRVESAKTQDHVRETLAIRQEEAEDVCFVPSAPSEPRGPTYWCDSRCSEKAIRYWQIASMVVQERGETHTYNEKLMQQGKQPLKLWQWRGVVEKEAH